MATDVAVLIPWRSGCPHRESAFEWVRARYERTHSDWDVIVGEHDEGPWCKALAIAVALERCDAGTVVVADADVWCGGLAAGVRALEGGAPWVVPHRLVCRLTADATGEVLTGGGLPAARQDRRAFDQRPYEGYAGGGITILSADTLRSVPMDPRFEGWGQEDRAWAQALTLLVGSPVRLGADLWHLWHPPQERLSRVKGSQASWVLAERYRRARTPEAMRRLVGEAQQVLA